MAARNPDFSPARFPADPQCPPRSADNRWPHVVGGAEVSPFAFGFLCGFVLGAIAAWLLIGHEPNP